MSEEVGVAFDKEDAMRIIITAIENGAIRFPFSGGLDVDSVLAKFRKELKNEKPDDITYDEFIRSAKVSAVAYEIVGLARFDALYLLALYETHTIGMTEKEAGRIQTAILN